MMPVAGTRPSLREPARRSTSSQSSVIRSRMDPLTGEGVQVAVVCVGVDPPEAGSADVSSFGLKR